MEKQPQKALNFLDKDVAFTAMKSIGLSVILYVVWGAYSAQNRQTNDMVKEQNRITNERVDRLESRLQDCQTEKQNEVLNSLIRIENVLINKSL